MDVDCCVLGIECSVDSERRDVRYKCESCRMLCVKIMKFEIRVVGCYVLRL